MKRKGRRTYDLRERMNRDNEENRKKNIRTERDNDEREGREQEELHTF